MILWLACATPEAPAPQDSPAPPAAPAPPAPSSSSSPQDTGEPPPEDPQDPGHLPVIFVHGIDGSAADWDTVRARLVQDGWPEDLLFAQTFEDPSWGCNLDNAQTIAGWVDAVLAQTGADRVDLVAHSMGTLSSRYFVKNLGGTELVNTYATLGGMHHGLQSSCSPDFPFKPCVWDEICTTGELVTQLNEEPATPGELHWVSIYGTADTTVPNWSSELDGAELVAIPGVEHAGPQGLQEDEATYAELARVLSYPRW
jgi:triacylglycerol lipase